MSTPTNEQAIQTVNTQQETVTGESESDEIKKRKSSRARIVDDVSSMSVFEVADPSKLLEDKWGIEKNN